MTYDWTRFEPSGFAGIWLLHLLPVPFCFFCLKVCRLHVTYYEEEEKEEIRERTGKGTPYVSDFPSIVYTVVNITFGLPRSQ